MRPADPHDEENDAALALEALLRWYVDMGVDAAIDAAPHDRFAAPLPPAAMPRAAPTPEKAASPPASRPLEAASSSAEELVRQAEALATAASTIDDLHASWESVPGCQLGKAARFIAAGGALDAPLMLVGAAPEEDDERAGAAFAGAHGRLLDAMLRAIGRDRTNVSLVHVVPWRPPGGRAPTPLELALCLPFVRRQIALARPKLLLCLGERAAQPLLDTRESLTRLRGRWFEHAGDAATVKTLVTFSPSYLLKQPLQKRRAWADLQMLAALADAEHPRR